MIKVLKNYYTENYHQLKNHVLAGNFPWVYIPVTTFDGSSDMSFYGHEFLRRPEMVGFTQPISPLLELNLIVLKEIIDSNKLFDVYYFLRSNANCTHPDGGEQYSKPHIDHPFPHYNLLIYLTEGITYIDGKKYVGKEDDVILFTGEHYIKRPTNNRRVVLISTLVGQNID